MMLFDVVVKRGTYITSDVHIHKPQPYNITNLKTLKVFKFVSNLQS